MANLEKEVEKPKGDFSSKKGPLEEGELMKPGQLDQQNDLQQEQRREEEREEERRSSERSEEHAESHETRELTSVSQNTDNDVQSLGDFAAALAARASAALQAIQSAVAAQVGSSAEAPVTAGQPVTAEVPSSATLTHPPVVTPPVQSVHAQEAHAVQASAPHENAPAIAPNARAENTQLESARGQGQRVVENLRENNPQLAEAISRLDNTLLNRPNPSNEDLSAARQVNEIAQRAANDLPRLQGEERQQQTEFMSRAFTTLNEMRIEQDRSGQAEPSQAENFRAGMEQLNRITEIEPRLSSAGAPRSITDGLRDTFNSAVGGGNAQQRETLRSHAAAATHSAQTYATHPNVINKTPTYNDALSHVMAGPRKVPPQSITPEETSRSASSETLANRRISAGVDAVDRQANASAREQLRQSISQNDALTEATNDPALRNELQLLSRDMRGVLERLDRNEHVEDSNMNSVEERLSLLDAVRSSAGPEASAERGILNRAFSASREGNPESFRLQTMMLRQYRNAQPPQRVEIASRSDALSQGRVQPQQALNAMRDGLLNSLRDLGMTDPQMRASIEMVARQSAADVRSVGRLNQVVSVARQIRADEIELSRQRNEDDRLGGMMILRRAASALANGADIAISASQAELATRYINGHPDNESGIMFMSDRLENAALISAMSSTLSQQNLNNDAVREAARGALGSNVPESRVSEVVSEFNRFRNAGTDQSGNSNYMVALVGQLEAFMSLRERRDAIGEMQRHERRESVFAGVHQRMTQDLDAFLDRFADGRATAQEANAIDAQSALLVGTPAQIARAFATSEDPRRQIEQIELMRGVHNMHEAAAGLRGPQRAEMLTLYQRATDALSGGRTEDAAAYTLFANAYASNQEDRPLIMRLVSRFNRREDMNRQTGEPPINTEQAMFLGRALLDRAESRAITDRHLQSDYLEYSNLGMSAYLRGDRNGAAFIHALSERFAMAARQGAEGERIARRISAGMEMGGLLLPSLSALQGGLGGPNPPSVSAIVDPTTGSAENLEERAAQNYSRLASSLDVLDAEIGQAAMAHRTSRLNLSSESVRRRYAEESARLNHRAATTHDQAQASEYRQDALASDVSRVSARMNESQQLYSEGVNAIRRASDLRTQAANLQGNDVERIRGEIRNSGQQPTDDSVRVRIEAEATDQLQRGNLLMRAAEGEQASVMLLHSSIMNLETRNRHLGRASLDRAAGEFSAAGAAVLAQRAPMTDEFIEQQRGSIRAGNADLDAGAAQYAIQQREQRAIERIDRATVSLERQSRALANSSVDSEGHPIQDLEVRDGVVIRSGRPAYNHALVSSELAGIRAAARRGELSSAVRRLGAINDYVSVRRGRVEMIRTHQDLMSHATEEERQQGYMGQFRTDYYLSDLEHAEAAALRGDRGRMNAWMSRVGGRSWSHGLRGEVGVFSSRQSLLNTANSERRNALDAEERGAPHILSTSASRSADNYTAYTQAYNADTVERGANLAAVSQDANEQARQARQRADHLEEAMESIHNENDIVDSSIAPRIAEALGNAQTGGAPNMSEANRRQLEQRMQEGGEEAARAYLSSHPQPDPRQLEAITRQGREREGMGYLLSHPQLMRDGAAAMRAQRESYLASHPQAGQRGHEGELEHAPGMTSSGEAQLNAQAEHYNGVLAYQEHAAGWNVAVDMAQRAVDNLNQADALRRANRGTAEERGFLRGYAATYTQIAAYASSNPASVAHDIERGREIQLPIVNIAREAHTFREGAVTGAIVGSEVEGYSFTTGSRQSRIPDAIHDTTLRSLDTVQSIEQGMNRNYHRQAGVVANFDLDMTMAGYGYSRNEGGGYSRLNLSQSEQRSLQAGMHAAAEARSRFMQISSSLGGSELGREASAENAQNSFLEIEGMASRVREAVNPILRAGSDPGHTPISGEALHNINEEIESATRDMGRQVDYQLSQGQHTERNVGYGQTAATIVGSALLTATGAGTEVGLYGLTTALMGFQEQAIAAGGYDSLTSNQRLLGWGGIAMAGMPILTSGLGSLVSAESTALSSASRVEMSMEQFENSLARPFASRGLSSMLNQGGPSGVLGTLNDTANWVNRLGNLEFGAAQVYGVYQHRTSTDAGFFDYFFPAFNALAPTMQMGANRLVRLSPGLAGGEGGSAGYRAAGFAYRASVAMLFGTRNEELVAEVNAARAEGYNRALAGTTENNRRMLPVVEQVAAQRIAAEMPGVELRPNALTGLLRHYTDAEGHPVDFEPNEAANLLASYHRSLEARLRALPDESYRLIAQAQMDSRPFEAHELSAVISNIGNLHTPTEVINFVGSHGREAGRADSPHSISGFANEQRTAYNRARSDSIASVTGAGPIGPQDLRVPGFGQNGRHAIEEVATVSAAAESIVRSPISGEGLSANGVREVLTSLGVPPAYTDTVLSLANDRAFIDATRAQDGPNRVQQLQRSEQALQRSTQGTAAEQQRPTSMTSREALEHIEAQESRAELNHAFNSMYDTPAEQSANHARYEEAREIAIEAERVVRARGRGEAAEIHGSESRRRSVERLANDQEFRDAVRSVDNSSDSEQRRQARLTQMRSALEEAHNASEVATHTQPGRAEETLIGPFGGAQSQLSFPQPSGSEEGLAALARNDARRELESAFNRAHMLPSLRLGQRANGSMAADAVMASEAIIASGGGEFNGNMPANLRGVSTRLAQNPEFTRATEILSNKNSSRSERASARDTQMRLATDEIRRLPAAPASEAQPAGPVTGPPVLPAQTAPTRNVAEIPTSDLQPNNAIHGRELARRLLSQDSQISNDARARIQSFSQSERDNIGHELANEMRLYQQGGVEEFGRMLAQGRAGSRELLAMLPENLRQEMGRLVDSGNLAGEFRLPRTRREAVREVANNIQRMIDERAMHTGPGGVQGTPGLETALRELATAPSGNFDQSTYDGQNDVQMRARRIEEFSRPGVPEAGIPADLREAVRLVRRAGGLSDEERGRFIAAVAAVGSIIPNGSESLNLALRQRINAADPSQRLTEAQVNDMVEGHRQFMVRRLLEISQLPAEERPNMLRRFQGTMDYMLARSVENPSMTAEWIRMINENPNIETLELIARRMTRLEQQSLEVARPPINVELEEAYQQDITAVRSRPGYTPADVVRAVIQNTPDGWFPPPYNRQRIIDSLAHNPNWRTIYNAIRAANAAINPHGLSLFGNDYHNPAQRIYPGVGLYRINYELSSSGWDTTRGLMVQPLETANPSRPTENVDPLINNAAVFDPFTQRIFLHSSSEDWRLLRGRFPPETIARIVFLHELQHLFDNATGFLRPERDNLRETTTIARETIQMLALGMSGEQLEDYLTRRGGRDPGYYQTGAESLRDFLNHQDPAWFAETDNQRLIGWIEQHIDELYSSNGLMRFRDILGPTRERVPSLAEELARLQGQPVISEEARGDTIYRRTR